ncbi:hypothetical protein OG948_33575 [Embleya sp. NBC_00888]|nr:hypothetical protein OG948_33575 [Embleya sp. NBC_00888]
MERDIAGEESGGVVGASGVVHVGEDERAVAVLGEGFGAGPYHGVQVFDY